MQGAADWKTKPITNEVVPQNVMKNLPVIEQDSKACQRILKRETKRQAKDKTKFVGMIILISLLFIIYLLFVAMFAFGFAYSGSGFGAMAVIILGLLLGIFWLNRWLKVVVKRYKARIAEPG